MKKKIAAAAEGAAYIPVDTDFRWKENAGDISIDENFVAQNFWHDVFVRFFSNFVNGKMCSKKKVVEKMSLEHRYLQSEMFMVCMAYITKLAENYARGYYDGRNEYACKTAKTIVNHLNEIDYPY